MLIPVRSDDPNRCQKEYYRRKRDERRAYQRAYEARRRDALRGAGIFAGSRIEAVGRRTAEPR